MLSENFKECAAIFQGDSPLLSSFKLFQKPLNLHFEFKHFSRTLRTCMNSVLKNYCLELLETSRLPSGVVRVHFIFQRQSDVTTVIKGIDKDTHKHLLIFKDNMSGK